VAVFLLIPADMDYDKAFIAELRKGDRKSFEKLFLNTYESLCEYSASIINSKEDAEGAVQDVFASLWQNRATLSEDLNLKAFLFRSVKNRSIDLIQHKSIRKKYQEHLTTLYHVSGNEETISTNNIMKRVAEEVEKLPEKCKTVYLLHRRDGLTYDEIAQVLGISKKSVEARMTKALKTLRDRLKNETDLSLLPFFVILSIKSFL
jgi:RNA polymerase sigma-70 factor, ECF subfamily